LKSYLHFLFVGSSWIAPHITSEFALAVRQTADLHTSVCIPDNKTRNKENTEMNRGLRLQICVLRKLLLSRVGMAVFALPVVLGLTHAVQVSTAAAAENPAVGIVGTWQGTLYAEEAKLRGLRFDPGKDLRLVVKISKADDGAYKALCHDIDQSGNPIPVTNVSFDGTTVKMSIPYQRSNYAGKMAADGRTITGFIWNSDVGPGNNPMPLNLTRATPETEWIIPSQPSSLAPMDPNATPSFESTIKPSKPGQRGSGFGLVQGNSARAANVTFNDLIAFAFDIHPKQAIGTPPWAGTEKFDIELKAEGEGAPSGKQWKAMLQKLLTDRFKLVFHLQKKELPVYALSVCTTGPKLTKSGGDPNGPPALEFGALGTLHVTNASMASFAQAMQAVVLDKPVVDQTGLEGRYDFDLHWTHDNSQFAGIEAKIPFPTDGANSPPPLDKAIQEQLGLKLDASAAPVEVLVMDHVEKPPELRN
jgi:uncharacterized protein (TIGR03435 family)